jgi:hypothetical protein
MVTHVRRARVAATHLISISVAALALCLTVDRSIRW